MTKHTLCWMLNSLVPNFEEILYLSDDLCARLSEITKAPVSRIKMWARTKRKNRRWKLKIAAVAGGVADHEHTSNHDMSKQSAQSQNHVYKPNYLSRAQRNYLCEYFDSVSRPTEEQKAELSEYLGLEKKVVSSWFRRKRYRVGQIFAKELFVNDAM